MRQMKDSGIEWIGEIPEEWSCAKLSYYIEIFTGNSISDGEKERYEIPNGIPYIATKDINVVYSSVDYDNGMKVPFDSNFKIAQYGSVLLCIEGGSAGKKIAFIDRDVAFVNKLCAFKARNDFVDKYIYYYIYSDAFVAPFNLSMTGLIGGVSQASIRNIKILLPKENEQQKIVEFLDKKCARIDSLIAHGKAEIEELKAYKQSVINETISDDHENDIQIYGGTLQWKTTSVEGWMIVKTLHCLEMPITDGPHETPELYDNGVPFLSAEAVKNGKLDFDLKRGYISQEFYEECCKKYRPRIQDIFMIKSGATTGNIAIVETDETFTIWSPLAVFRANSRVMPKYLYYLLQTNFYLEQVRLNWSFGTQQNIGMRVLETLKLLIPKVSNYNDY
ncbi:MAG: restriction endonuclease subunit S [Lachnospiraceae bacterium]|nr:restriction endonuclease subunit S [Lachnospiraceae bacterium]